MVPGLGSGTIAVDGDSDPGIDRVQPFQIERSGLRGRLVRLGPSVEAVLAAHDYPEPVARLLSEALVLANILASTLKFDGVFTLQTKGDGPVPTLVADVTSGGDVRGFAKVVPERLPAAAEATVPGLIGAGYLAFTVDQGPNTQRYQGLVPLEGETLSECVRAYFRQSEQIDTGIRVAAGRSDGHWLAGGVMLQRLPEDRAEAAVPASDTEDDWRRAMVLLHSLTDDELLSPNLGAHAMLYRLFHEDGVRVFRSREVRMACRCSRERLAGVLRSFSAEELSGLAEEDGSYSAVCEFCGTAYRFTTAELA